MWGKVSSMLGLAPSAAEDKDEELHLATAALLVHVSMIDDDFSVHERNSLLVCMQDQFGLTVDVATQIIDDAHMGEETVTCLYQFTRVIAKELDQEGRQDIVRLLWQAAFADNHLDNFEANLLAKIAGLLGVAPEDRIRIKHEVMAAKA